MTWYLACLCFCPLLYVCLTISHQNLCVAIFHVLLCLLFCFCALLHIFMKSLSLRHSLHFLLKTGHCLGWCVDLQYVHLLPCCLCVILISFVSYLSLFCLLLTSLLMALNLCFLSCLLALQFVTPTLRTFGPHQCLLTCDFTGVLLRLILLLSHMS